MAETKLQTTLVLGATDAASAAIRRVAGETKNLGNAVAATGKTAESSDKAFSNIREKSGDVESALKGVGDFAGGAEHAVKGLGDAFGATEAVMRLLPGPMGLTAAAIVGAALGAKLLADHIRQSAEKMRQLGGASAAKLKEDLDLSADAAVALSQAMEDLPDKGLRPSVALMRQVKENAEAMGKDGAEAAKRFVEALAKGPEGLKDFQREFGKLSGATAVDSAVLATRLGLQAEALGLSKQQSAEEQRTAEVKQAIARIAERQVELGKVQADLDRQSGLALEGATVAVRVNADLAAKESRRKEAALQLQISAERDALAGIQAEVLATKAAADARAVAASRIEVLDAEAASAADKANKVRLQGEAVVARQLAAVQALNTFDRQHGAVLAANLQIERDALKIKVLQSEAARLALRAQQQQEARQAADKARSAANAREDAVLRLRRARDDADGLQTQRDRILLILDEAAKERRAVNQSTAGAKTRGVQLAAIEQETNNKLAALKRELAEKDKVQADDIQKTIEASNARAAAVATQLAEATATSERSAAASVGQRLRELGDVDKAILAERAQARADYAAEVIHIDREIDASQKDLGEGSKARDDLESLRKLRQLAAARGLAEQQRRLDTEASQRMRESIAAAADNLEGVTKTLDAIAQIGPAYARAGTISNALQAGIKGFKDLDAAMASTERRAVKVTSAVGDTFAGVAAAVIDAERARTLAQLDNEQQRQLSTAQTEEERARVTQEFEDKKAKAIETAERQKAGIQAAVEAAKAIASAASYDYVAAAGHAAAAVAFGALALGAVGGSAAGGAGSGGAGGFTTPGGGAGAAAGGGGGGKGTSVVVNFNQPLVTKQEVGKAITGALRSVGSTGMAKAKGV